MTKSKTLTPTEYQEIKKRLATGETSPAIARSLGRNPDAFLLTLRRMEKQELEGKTPPAWEPTLTLPDDIGVIAYIAGLIDGEGTIIKANPQEETKRGYSWQVKVAMTNREIIDWLGQYGGRVQKNPPPKKENWNQSYVWVISRRKDVIYLLERIKPYLIVKRDRANEALKSLLLRE